MRTQLNRQDQRQKNSKGEPTNVAYTLIKYLENDQVFYIFTMLDYNTLDILNSCIYYRVPSKIKALFE